MGGIGGEYAGRRQRAEPERQRLSNLARRLNPGTQRWLRERGIRAGWRCLEVGAAEGSMARWLAEQVGPSGHVVAADIDLRFLDGLDLPNVELRELDLRNDALEADHYDLAYCRTLLLHLPDAAAALRKLADALRPGGWLLVQDPDARVTSAADLDHPKAERFEGLIQTIYRWLRARDIFDAYFGRSLPRLVASLGLEDVGSEGVAFLVRGGSEQMQSYKQTIEALAPMLRAKEVIGDEDLAFLLALYDDPGFEQLTEIQFAAWGRKSGPSARPETSKG